MYFLRASARAFALRGSLWTSALQQLFMKGVILKNKLVWLEDTITARKVNKVVSYVALIGEKKAPLLKNWREWDGPSMHGECV